MVDGKMNVFSDKTILITGASSGIGRELALRFSDLGASLILVSSNLDNLKKLGIKAQLVKCDMADQNDIDKMRKDFLKKTDILINNAGIGAKEYFADEDYSEFKKIVDVNFTGMTYLTKKYLAARDSKKESFIVNVCSIAGVIYVPFMSAYSSSKAAAYFFTRLLGLELSGTKIRVMAVVPGPAKTNFGNRFKNKMKHSRFYEKYIMLTPEKIAEKIIAGIRKNRKVIFIPWYLRWVSVFNILFPGLYDKAAINSLRRMKLE